MQKDIIKALNWRYAVKQFDISKKLDENVFQTILESARLAPSPFGVEPWKFVFVQDKAVRQRLHDEASGLPKIIDASHYVVVAKRTDAREALTRDLISRTAKTQNVNKESLKGLEDMVSGFIASLDDAQLDKWVSGQTYIPLGIMVETAALLGVDTGPMEGFNREKYDEILDLKSKNLASVYAIAFGYRADDKFAEMPKVRRTKEDVELII